MKFIFLFVTIVVLNSCIVQKAGGILSNDEGYQYFQLSNPDLQVQLLGDYWVHSLKKKYLTDVSKNFLKYSMSSKVWHKPLLMYSAHTTVEPYYSTIGVLYRNANVDSASMDIIKAVMKTDFKTSMSKSEVIQTAFGPTIRFTYQVTNPITRIRTSHVEYLINHGEHLARFFFWTTNTDKASFYYESDEIMKSLK